MARAIMCGLCGEEVAEIMYMTLADSSTVEVGPNCAPGFVLGLAVAVGLLPDPSEEPAPAKPARKPRKASQAPDASDPTEEEINSPQGEPEAVS